MLLLRVSTIGQFSKEAKKMKDNKVIMDEGDDMEIIDYLKFYYDNRMSNKIGYISDIQFSNIFIWDTEEKKVIKDLMDISPDNKYR